MLIVVALSACTSGGASHTAVAPTPTVDLGPPRPERERVLEHIRVLSEQIGVRLAGSAAEQRAVDYAKQQLEGWGYQVQVQPFPATGDLLRDVSLAVEGSRTITGAAFASSAQGTVRGPLVAAGAGAAGAFPADSAGAVALVQRQDVPFADMAAHALAAGAVALVVANKEPGPFQGGFAQQVGLPVIAIDQGDGQSLRDRLAAGPVEVTVTVSEPHTVTAHNVIARRAGRTCRTISGGHIDSVPWAPGANDNASGSALVLELARAAAAAGLQDNCFALFSGEEEGLLGSAFFVSGLSEQDRGALQVYYNYDVVASNARPLALGTRAQLDRAGAVAQRLGLDVQLSERVEDIGSDHRSFLGGGIPALFLTSPEFARIHTPGDVVANLDPAFLEGIGQLGFALLQEPASGLPTPSP